MGPDGRRKSKPDDLAVADRLDRRRHPRRVSGRASPHRDDAVSKDLARRNPGLRLR